MNKSPKRINGERSWCYVGIRLKNEDSTGGVGNEVIIEDQLLAYISSKLLGKEKVTGEELRSILEKTAQAKDLKSQNTIIKALEEKGIIRNEGDGTWKVSLKNGTPNNLLELYKQYSGTIRSRKDLQDELGLLPEPSSPVYSSTPLP